MDKIVEFIRPMQPYNVGEKAGFPIDYANYLVSDKKVAKWPSGASTVEDDVAGRKREISRILTERGIGFFKGATLPELEAKLASAINEEASNEAKADLAESDKMTAAMVALEEADQHRPKFSTLTQSELAKFCVAEGLDVQFADCRSLSAKQKLVSDAYDVQA